MKSSIIHFRILIGWLRCTNLLGFFYFLTDDFLEEVPVNVIDIHCYIWKDLLFWM